MLTTKHAVLGDAEIEAIAAAVRSADLSGTSVLVSRYEADLAHWFGVRFAVACSSGTAAVHLALMATGVQAGDEVLVPATAPVMTALPVLALGAKPIFVDVADATSFQLNLADAERKRSGRTRAVISVPMWGYPADGQELVQACRSWDLPLIEDAAQAHGSRLDGRYLGTAGVIGAFSTHMRKLVSTGEGGFCLTDDDQVADRLRELHDLGRPADVADGGFGERFGLNYKLTGLAAAVGTVQLQRLPGRLARRREVAERLSGGLVGVPGLHRFRSHPAASPTTTP
jgi:dTDP-4-amino-4,6-dideoxygalactose transaminase